jgi:hypothetical protein
LSLLVISPMPHKRGANLPSCHASIQSEPLVISKQA